MPTIAGIDPGLVHTGIVVIQFDNALFTKRVDHAVVDGCDPQRVKFELLRLASHRDNIFIENYRSRSNFNTNVRMHEAVRAIRVALPRAQTIDNMGIKKIVTPALLDALGAWRFSTPTHHDDLRSAARIAVLGALKDDALNKELAIYVANFLDRRSYTTI